MIINEFKPKNFNKKRKEILQQVEAIKENGS
jgi:GH35 family endo-1,4-beta-xylanase